MSSQPPALRSDAPLHPWAMAVRFIALSGLGWLCDLATFTLLVRLAAWEAGAANIASSYAGVTLVWFASLKTVFRRAGDGRFLLTYWGFQLLSILAYSHLLGLAATAAPSLGPWDGYRPLAAKLFITPFNLITNFIFMKLLTRHMRPR